MLSRLFHRPTSLIQRWGSISASRSMYNGSKDVPTIKQGKEVPFIKRQFGGGGVMEDEYGDMDASGSVHKFDTFELECGKVLKEAQVCYNTWGTLNEARDNVLVVCHALTGNSRLDTWWKGLLGSGQPFDTEKYLVVCANILGSCYGTTGPNSIDPDTGERYGRDFGPITVRDTVNLHMRLLKECLGVNRVAGVVGGSLGGMQALEWSIMGGKDFVRCVVAIGCGATHTGWQIGMSETQRQAIYADPKWRDGRYPSHDPPHAGLAVARQIAMCSYRSFEGFSNKFGRSVTEDGAFQVKNYLEYQGQKFLSRFDPLTYVQLTEQLDTHDVGRDRGGVANALGKIDVPLLVIGIDSDILYPLGMQQEVVDLTPGAKLKVVKSINGHDGFLLEQEDIGSAIKDFLVDPESSS